MWPGLDVPTGMVICSSPSTAPTCHTPALSMDATVVVSCSSEKKVLRIPVLFLGEERCVGEMGRTFLAPYVVLKSILHEKEALESRLTAARAIIQLY